jgi:site-specific DNA-methyltransferase (adenine-specific)
MTFELNKVHHSDWMENGLPDKSCQLILADPPYFQVKGDFDFIWESFEDYLVDVEKWAKECKRLLADNGTLFWWGNSKNIAYSQIILDKYFNLENSLVWRIKDSIQYQYYSPDLARTFNTHNQRLLMYSNEIEFSDLESIKLDIENFTPLRQYFKDLQEWIGIPKSKIVEAIGQTADHCFRWGSSQWDMPTEETYNKLIEIFKIDTWSGFRPYYSTSDIHSNLMNQYEGLRRFFYNPMKYEEVLEFSQESQTTRLYDHETVKTELLSRMLILTCSRPNDLVLICFAGSGTESAMALKEKRKFIGFDINEKYVKMSNDRCAVIAAKPELF